MDVPASFLVSIPHVLFTVVNIGKDEEIEKAGGIVKVS